MTKRKAVVSLSGGMDSVTVLAEALAKDRDVLAVGFNYGSKHNPYENAAAKEVAAHYGVPFKLMDLTSIGEELASDLLTSGGDIPEGHYEAESMSKTVVPGRNIIFASVLAGVAWSVGAEEIWLGVHAGDHHIYPDCRPTFIHAMNAAICAGTDEAVEIITPYLHGNKSTIIHRGQQIGVPYHLTRTCYKDQQVACGKCGSCQERLEAFEINHLIDPIKYEERKILSNG